MTQDTAIDHATQLTDVRGPFCVCALAGCLAFAAFVVGYARLAGPAIADLDRSLGIVQFERGQRYQEAGEYANAVQCYRLALEGSFEDPRYRTFTLKALGALLWWREGPDAALPYLEEAYAQSQVPITLYAPLCDSLLQVGRTDDVEPVCERWRKDAVAQHDAEQHAQAMYYLGRVRREQGDEAGARESFARGVELHPGGFNAYELGVSHFRSGEYEKALAYFDEFLEGGSGGRAEYARKLRAEILKKLGSSQ